MFNNNNKHDNTVRGQYEPRADSRLHAQGGGGQNGGGDWIGTDGAAENGGGDRDQDQD